MFLSCQTSYYLIRVTILHHATRTRVSEGTPTKLTKLCEDDAMSLQRYFVHIMLVILFFFFSLENLKAQTCSGIDLISENSNWKYDDTNTNLGTSWRNPGFDDSGWPEEPGVLGYGESYINTTLPSGRITYYFRHSFNMPVDPAMIATLQLRANYDDGFVAYINGVEVTRQSLPGGTINFNTTASSHEGGSYGNIDITAFADELVSGTNVLAVEVHNQSSGSSDIVWDASLDYTLSSVACLTRGPYLQTGTPGSVVVRWRTDTATNSSVSYGTDPANLSITVDVLSSTTEHEVQLASLTADTKYYYSVGSTTEILLLGNGQFFVTSPIPGTRKKSRFWIIGDSGTGNNDARNVRDAYAAFTDTTHTDLWIMLGDNAYDDGTDAEHQTAVFDMYPVMLKKSVLWPAFGNHEGRSADSDTETGAFYDIFTLPRNAEAGGLASGTEAYYSFDYANIHFICLNSYDVDRSVGGAMMTWLENDLAATNREWIIAFWHHPAYTKGSHDSDDESTLIQMRENGLPILEAGGVDLAFFGHSHSYERSYLLDGHYGNSLSLLPEMILDNGNGREDGDGIYIKPTFAQTAHEGAVYIVAGSSGKTSNSSLDHPAMFESLVELGSVVLDIDGDRADVQFLNDNGTVRDYFTLLKGDGNESPTVSITSPAESAVFTEGDAVTINADASDSDGSVTLVEFFANGTKLGEDNLSPFSFIWSNVANGSYSLTAIATDNVGAQKTSDAVNIIVDPVSGSQVMMCFQDGVAPTAVYAGTRDTYLNENNSPSNAGSATTLLVDGDDPFNTGEDKSTILKWDISTIPPEAVIQSVSVTINVTDFTTQTYELYELERVWFENEATWNDFAGGSAWQSDGAKGANDRGSTVLGTAAPGQVGSYTIDLNATGVTLVQGWINNLSSNNGLIIADENTSDGIDFSSSETIVAGSRPKLTVIYIQPEGANDPIEVITKNDTWKYHDGGVDLGTAWQASGYDDSGWSSGQGTLGYGESFISTTLQSGRRTYYFRKNFSIPVDPATIFRLLLRVNYDDGFVVYLNGTEAARSTSMPSGTITYNTLASLHEGGSCLTIDLSASIGLLNTGSNVVAVEVHNANTSSSDIVMDMSLEFTASNIPPTVAITNPINDTTFTQGDAIEMAADAADSDGSIILVEFFQGSSKLGDDNTTPYEYTWNGAIPGNYNLTAVATDDNGAVDTSVSVAITVYTSNSVFRVERTTGDVFAAGSFIGSGADIAEHINISESVEPGDVIELDPDKPRHYRKARGSGQLIAGVITTQPGFTLGNSFDEMVRTTPIISDQCLNLKITSRPMLALMGRVPVKVTTENGAIQPGDLLTISNKPGHAMRCTASQKRTSAIIGKALEGLTDSDGIILVLVMAY